MTRDRSADTLLFAMGGAMLVVTILACVLIVVPTMLWLVVAYGGLLVLAAGIGLFVGRFIETDH